METYNKKQVLKAGLIEIIKSTKGIKNEALTVRTDAGRGYWIYDGMLLKNDSFNIHYSIQYHKLTAAALKKDTVYIVSTADERLKKLLF
jgi:hypothetical protein